MMAEYLNESQDEHENDGTQYDETQLDSDNLIEISTPDVLTSEHLSIILSYIKINEKFLDDPLSYDKLVKPMTTKLNAISCKKTAMEWINFMNEWKKKTREKYRQYRINKKIKFTTEELELLFHLKVLETSTATEFQLSCMLDHIEIANDSPALWSTIALEMESEEEEEKSETYWKNIFEKWCIETKKKEILYKNYDKENSFNQNKPNIFTNLEKRLIEFLSNENIINLPINLESEIEVVYANYCRVCMNTSIDLINIFDSENNLSGKIEQCACIVPIEKDDGFPQSICMTCLNLLEQALKFKIICEKSDQKLRSMAAIKNVYYIANTDGDDYELRPYDEMQVEKIEQTSDHDMSENLDEEIDVYESINIINDDDDNIDNDDDGDDQDDNDDDFNETIKSETDAKKKIPSSNKTRSKIIIQKNLDENINQCEFCGYLCGSPNLLKNHMKSHRTGKNHQCVMCGKEFKTRLSLKIHMRSHTGERPYVCETCGKAFKTYSAVNNHRAIHSVEKEFKCDLCPYRGCTKANLKIHERTHTGVQPYSCRYCSMKFSTASNMHKHIRNIHEKMKSNKCDQCAKSFFSCESLRKHMVIHTGLKPYKCPLCHIPYGWYNGLQKHMKMQHRDAKIPTEKSFFSLTQNSIESEESMKS